MQTRSEFGTAMMMLAALVCCAGCGEPSPYVPVHGTVTYQGEPVEGATVVFTGKGERGRAAADFTDAEGHFELWTYVNSDFTADGAIPDDYDVYLEKRGPRRRVKVQPGARKARDLPQDGSMAPDEVLRLVYQGLVDPGGPPIMLPGESLIPERYCIPNKSLFQVTVERDKPNEFKFVLEDE
ncbi:MAG TPA: carboxypeptidase-like regulatory domain-containing protein [Pirellulales bacterium]|nr:carboxypeptidase-like regulatory domain-containing protein [Pirellulales bacterium]